MSHYAYRNVPMSVPVRTGTRTYFWFFVQCTGTVVCLLHVQYKYGTRVEASRLLTKNCMPSTAATEISNVACPI